jgi:small-conductance mechanosensitive channel
MMKKVLIIGVLLMLMVSEAGAVLKEKDLQQTLAILKTELQRYNTELKERTLVRNQRNKRIIQELVSTMKRADQNALMLYSQQQENVFDLTYACHEATQLYHEFHSRQLPFKTFLSNSEREIARYDSLISSLQYMPEKVLGREGVMKRDSCVMLAESIRSQLKEGSSQLERYISYYDRTENRLSGLNDYAQKRYSDIQQNIFINGSSNYFSLLSRFSRNWHSLSDAMEKKYSLYANENSDWSSQWILGTFIAIGIFVIVAILLNQLFFRLLLPKRFDSPDYRKKRPAIIMATTTVTFALIQGLFVNNTGQNFLVMASSLLVEYAWLLGVILISLLLRVDGDQIRSAFRIYSPLIVIGFIVIVFRIVLVPNELVNMILPPILLGCALWQWSVIRRHNKNIPRSDIFYTYISLTVFTASVVCAWAGYTLLAVQLLIWWIMQLTCILTITCVTQYIRNYAQRHGLADKPASKTWGYRLVEQVVMPVLSVLSLMVSVYWAAKVFNLSELCWRIFNYQFIDLENLKVSILKLSIVICLWFLFRWITSTILSLLRMHYVHRDPTTAASREVMGRNVIQVFVWGVWLMISLSILDISVTWLVAISGGLSTGIGFASKDIIENIYYGASLMAGRIKVGDWIEVNGSMGKVRTISYTSTVVDSLYGEVITFQNSQLFKSNYKNLTRNHGFVLAVVPFGVAYGSNLKEVSKLVEEAVNSLRHPWMDLSKPVKSVVSEMGDSSVNFKLFVWADAPKKSYVISDVLKCVYDTLNTNGISIPFPQRDVHIVK